ncbi:MAG: hypothetical protein L6N96_01205 [Candidatus Methylarchaceae archaeon HK02M2]|nr:hypothetical protein [Candidatus Methylarchaceae archaeon HK02M2]
MTDRSWTAIVKERKKSLKNLAPKDRLGYVEGCIQSLLAVNQSINGWMQWLSNPMKMGKFEEEQLEMFFTKLRQFALDFLEFDRDVTEKDEKGKEQPRVEHFK